MWPARRRHRRERQHPPTPCAPPTHQAMSLGTGMTCGREPERVPNAIRAHVADKFAEHGGACFGVNGVPPPPTAPPGTWVTPLTLVTLPVDDTIAVRRAQAASWHVPASLRWRRRLSAATSVRDAGVGAEVAPTHLVAGCPRHGLQVFNRGQALPAPCGNSLLAGKPMVVYT